MFEGISFDMSTVLMTSYRDGFPVVQYEANGEEPDPDNPDRHDPVADDMSLQHAYGFYSRPLDCEPSGNGTALEGKGCAVKYGEDGSLEGYAWLGHDPRIVPFLPKPDKGGSVWYGAVRVNAGEYQVSYGAYGDDGTLQFVIPISDSRSHTLTIGRDGNGEPELTLLHADGMMITMFDGQLNLSAPTINLDASVVNISGHVIAHDTMDVGGVGALAVGVGSGAAVAPSVSLRATVAPTP